MKPVKIYGMQRSAYTRHVVAACEELGVNYEIVKVDLLKGEHKSPEHLSRQPFGSVPVLDDSNHHGMNGEAGSTLRVFESSAICRYLATAYRGTKGGVELLPADPKAAAVVDNWMEVQSNYFSKPALSVVTQLVVLKWFGVTKVDEAVVEKGLQDLQQVLDVYEAQLSKQAYLAGDSFTLADLMHLPLLQYLMVEGGVTGFLDAHPAVKAWWQRCSARPVWSKVASGVAGADGDGQALAKGVIEQ